MPALQAMRPWPNWANHLIAFGWSRGPSMNVLLRAGLKFSSCADKRIGDLKIRMIGEAKYFRLRTELNNPFCRESYTYLNIETSDQFIEA